MKQTIYAMPYKIDFDDLISKGRGYHPKCLKCIHPCKVYAGSAGRRTSFSCNDYERKVNDE